MSTIIESYSDMKSCILVLIAILFLSSCSSRRCGCVPLETDERPYYKVIKIKEKEEWPFVVLYATSPLEGEEDMVHVILSLKPEELSEFSMICPDDYMFLADGRTSMNSQSDMQKQLWKFAQGDTIETIKTGCSYPFRLKDWGVTPIGKRWMFVMILSDEFNMQKPIWREIFAGAGDHDGRLYTSLNSFGRYMIGPDPLPLDIKRTAPDSISIDLKLFE